MATLDTSDLQVWLEWAGARLIAMPEPKIKPAQPRVAWPDYSQDSREVTDFRGRLSLRAVAPERDEIAMVDKILLLPNTCALPNVRRVLQVRALVHPINYRHLYSWVRISKLLGTSPYTVKRWHKRGLAEVLVKSPPDVLCEIKSFMKSHNGVNGHRNGNI